MADFPSYLTQIGSGGVLSSGDIYRSLITVNSSSGAWPTANKALFVPIVVPTQVTVYKLVAGGGTGAGGNCDLGIYDRSGNRIVSSGATAKVTSEEIVANITDTVIGPGLYYLAMAADGVDAYGTVSSTTQYGRLVGIVEAAASYVLPSTVTFGALTGSRLPVIAAYLRSQ